MRLRPDSFKDTWRYINLICICIYLPRKEERVSRPGWLTYTADGLTTLCKWSRVSCRLSAGQGHFAGQRPTFNQCATQPTCGISVQ